MCRDIFEIHYHTCSHVSYWAKPSPDSNCNGIRHHITKNILKVCKHCWVAAGNSKKVWRRLGLDGTPAERRARIKCRIFSIVYPIQDVSLRRVSECPTWKRHYPWQTRAWASRNIILRVSTAFDWMQAVNQNGVVPNHDVHYMDEDTAECPLLQLVEPEDLPRNPNPPHQVLYTHESCFCAGSFISDNPEEKHEAGDGGLRQLPCRDKHVFCLSCIRQVIFEQAECIRRAEEFGLDENQQMPEVRCPLCRTLFEVKISRTNMTTRRLDMVSRQRARVISSYTAWERDPENASFFGSWLGYLASRLS